MKLKDKFDFSLQFQDRVLALLFYDKSVLGSTFGFIESSHFDGSERVQLAMFLFEHYKLYSEGLSSVILSETINQSDLDDNEKSKLIEYFSKKIKPLKKKVLIDKEYIRDTLNSFVKYQSVVAALLQSKESVEQGNVDDVLELINKAFCSGTSSDIGIFHFDDEHIDERVAYRDKIAHEEDVLIVPTMLPELDRAIDGGLREGELATMVMGPGVGKTMWLIHVSGVAMLNGMGTVFYSLEMRKERLGDRFDAYFSGIPTNDLILMPEEVRYKLRERYEKPPYGELLVKYDQAMTINTSNIESHLTRLSEEQDFQPQLLVVDYADLLNPRYKTHDPYEDIARIYIELRNIGEKFHCAVWTACQTTKQGYGEDILDLDDAAGGFGKSKHSDFVVLGQKDLDNPQSSTRNLHLGKSRYGESGIIIPVQTEFAKARFYRVGG